MIIQLEWWVEWKKDNHTLKYWVIGNFDLKKYPIYSSRKNQRSYKLFSIGYVQVHFFHFITTSRRSHFFPPLQNVPQFLLPKSSLTVRTEIHKNRSEGTVVIRSMVNAMRDGRIMCGKIHFMEWKSENRENPEQHAPKPPCHRDWQGWHVEMPRPLV